MYIPAENVYYETILRDELGGEATGLLPYAMQKKVIPVSPNSFYAYLQVILRGLKGFAIEKRTEVILEYLARLRGEFGRFAGDFAKTGKHLANASSSYAERGVMVNFFLDEQHLRFELNLDSVRREQIEVNPQLLGLGVIVSSEGDQHDSLGDR